VAANHILKPVPTLFQRIRGESGLLAGLMMIFAALPLPAADAAHPVIVHEWGTFTSLQDEQGRAIGGINVDDEPVPNFVCEDGSTYVVSQHVPFMHSFGLPPYSAGKGWIGSDAAVTMRLETPVLYIYPPKGEQPSSIPPLKVHVDFHGGVLSQFYPEAQFEGLETVKDTYRTYHRGPLDADTVTGLTWSNVRLGSKLEPVKSNDPVWTTPRETSAPLLEVPTHAFDENGKPHPSLTAEHFLFYRGVGQINLSVQLERRPHEMKFKRMSPSSPVDKFDEGWMVEIRPTGTCAFHPVPQPVAVFYSWGVVQFAPGISIAFADSDFSTANLDVLKASMQAQLIKEGLYADEASAMLRTWELSYFKSPGLRFFYIAPNNWVNKVLPLRVTGAPVRITRVMVGRIELISDVQKQALARLAAGPAPSLTAVKGAAISALNSGRFSGDEQADYYSGRKPLRDLGIPIPSLVQDYLDLGRFRDALILREQQLHPTDSLAQFIKQNQIGLTAVNPPTQASGVAATR
jgi:hypothetical protein